MLKQKFSKIAFLKIFSVKIKVFLLLTLPILAVLNCNTTDPKLESELLLKLEDVSCTEAWLQLTTNNIQLPATINLLKNNSVTRTFSLSTQDSLLYIDSLMPSQIYSFQVSSIQNPVSSNKVTAATLDTTSHNFTWQTFEFGQHSSSVFYDVAIVDENNIWAVGEIYMNDSLGNPDPQRYNAIHWDGLVWKLKRIQTLFRGNIITVPLEGIFAFSATDIWMVGSLPIHGDGTNWTMYDLRATVDPNLSLSKVWGSSSNDMYFVGNNGNIAHDKNGNWTKIESGTSIDFQDIWGVDNKNGNFTKYIVAGSNMLKLDEDNKVESVNVTQNMILLSIWGKTSNLLYTAGNGAVLYKNYEWESLNISSINHMYKIRGQDFNDVHGISSPGNIINHFNGYSWGTTETEPENKYWALNVKDNTIVAVGYQLEQAVITVLKK